MANQPEKIDANSVETPQDENLNTAVADDDTCDDGVADIDVVSLQASLAETQAKADDNWQLYLSARAETDNVRKRAERDVANAHKYALEKFIPELLSVKDSLELGIKTAKDNIATAPDEQMQKFIEGSEMTLRVFADTLKKVGVEIIDPENAVFNPEFHEAMAMVPNPELPANTIIEVFQKGYTLNGRLLRPAKVIVSKAD